VPSIAFKNLSPVVDSWGSKSLPGLYTPIISRAYNPKLSEPENLKRVTRLLTQMESALKAKDEAVSYASKNGTLKGFDISKLVTSTSQFDLDEKKSATPPNKTPITDKKTSPFKPLDKMTEQELDAELEQRRRK